MDVKEHTIVNTCYILQEEVGHDSFSDIWRATAMFSATQFLLWFLDTKRVPKEGIEAFRQRGIYCYNIQHPALVDIVEIERFEDTVFIASEYGGKRCLRDILQKGVTFPVEHVCRFIVEIAEGLDAFHRKGIIYRHLNAESVWLVYNGENVDEIKILNPGYQSLVDYIDKADPQSVLENFSYMAPEVKGVTEYPVDERSDIYSIGVLLFKLLTGKLPFKSQSVDRSLNNSVSVLHVANSLFRRQIPEELSSIVVRALRRNPKLRYQSIIELIKDLKKFLDEKRKESLQAGLADPLASLDFLNRNKSRVEASRYVRAINSISYFQAITEGNPQSASKRQPLNVPVMPPWAKEMESFEELESVQGEDNDSYTVEDYLRLGKEALPESPSREVPVSLQKETSPQPVEAVPLPEEPREPEKPVESSHPAISESTVTPDTALSAVTVPLQNEEEPVFHWVYRSLHYREVLGKLEEAFAYATRGKGSFSCVGEPHGVDVEASFNQFFSELKGVSVFLELTAPPEPAACSELIRHLVNGIIRSTKGLDSRWKRNMRRRISYAGKGMHSRGKVSLSACMSAPERIPDGLILDPEDRKALAGEITAIGTKGCPLFLLIHGFHAVSKENHDFLKDLGGTAVHHPALVLLTYERSLLPPWHLLSQLIQYT